MLQLKMAFWNLASLFRTSTVLMIYEQDRVCLGVTNHMGVLGAIKA